MTYRTKRNSLILWLPQYNARDATDRKHLRLSYWIPKIAKSDSYFRHVCLFVFLSTWKNSAHIKRNFIKSDKIKVFLHKDLRKFMI